MLFEKDCENKISELINFSEQCSVVISHSVNDASLVLGGDKYVEDEESWLAENKVTPPFVTIHFKESQSRELRGGYRKIENGCLCTYDAFPDGKKEIIQWEKNELPSIVTALTVQLSTFERHVKLKPFSRSVYGLTEDGTTLFDFKVTFNIQGYASESLSLEKINENLVYASKMLPTLTVDISRNIYMALNEPDITKQFLGYFQFIERFTHSTYKTLRYTDDVKPLINIPSRLSQVLDVFFERTLNDSKSLSQRFHWCALLSWGTIDDKDVNDFLEVKKIRDKLSHGEHLEDSELPVQKTKILAFKLLGIRNRERN